MSAEFIVTSEPWQDFAACKGKDPNMFILGKGHTAAKAQAICQTCAVTEPCYFYGKVTGSVGVWGGRVLQFKNTNVIELFPLVEVEAMVVEPVKESERKVTPAILGRVANFSKSHGILGNREEA